MDNIFKTRKEINFSKLQASFENLPNIEPVSHRSSETDYGSDYFEDGSFGYGWALQEFECPENVKTVKWNDETIKSKPMIRSKGRISYNDGTSSVIGNEHYTKRRKEGEGYIGEILDMFPEAYRGAIWCIKPGFKFKVHIDYPWHKTYRMHIVLQTNDQSFFQIDDHDTHMEAGPAIWMIQTGDHMHTAFNNGDTVRVHMHWQMPIETWDKYLSELSADCRTNN